MARNLPIMVVAQAGDYTADDIVDTAQKVLMTAAERAKLAAVEDGAQVNDVTSVHGRTGVVCAAAGDYNAEQISDTPLKVLMTAAERAKLAAVEDGAQVNDVTSVHGRTGIVAAAAGDYNAEQISDTPLKVLMTAGERAKLNGVEDGAQVNDVTSVHGRTGVVCAAAGDYNAEQISDTVHKVLMTADERAKLAAVEDGAQVNDVTSVHGRTGVVTAAAGDYNADQILDGTAKVVMTSVERTKLQGIAAFATPNPIRVTAAEKSAGTGTTIRGYAPVDVRDIVATFTPAPPVASVAGRTGAVTLAKTDVGLGNVTDDAQIRANLAYPAKTSPASGDKLLLRDQADGQPKLIDWSQLPVPAIPVASVHGRTGTVVGQPGDYNSDQLDEGTQKLLMTPAERTRLAGIEEHAQVNPTRIIAAEKTAGTSTTVRGVAPIDVKDMVGTHGVRVALDYPVKASPATGDKIVVRDQADGSIKLVDWNSAVAALKSEADPFPQYTTTSELATALATKADIASSLMVMPVMFGAVTLSNVTNVEAGGINRACLDLSRASRARMTLNIGPAAGTVGQVAQFEYSVEATPTTWVALGPTLPLDVPANAGYISAWIDIPAVCKQTTDVWVRFCVRGGTASSVALRNPVLLIENVYVPAGSSASPMASNTYILDVTGNTTDLLFGVGADVAMTLKTISVRTVSGTCTIAFKRNTASIMDAAGGTSWAINATSAPITLSTSTPQTLPAYGKLYLTVTGASALSGLIIVISGVSS